MQKTPSITKNGVKMSNDGQRRWSCIKKITQVPENEYSYKPRKVTQEENHGFYVAAQVLSREMIQPITCGWHLMHPFLIILIGG